MRTDAVERPAVAIERAGSDEKSFMEVFDLLVALHKEGGYAPLNVRKAVAQTYSVLTEGMTFLARNAEREPIGVLTMTEADFWYSDGTFLFGRSFFVRPEYRRGRVGVGLLRAARDEGEARNKIVFVGIDNPDRKPKNTKAALVMQEAGFVPLGYMLRLR